MTRRDEGATTHYVFSRTGELLEEERRDAYGRVDREERSYEGGRLVRKVQRMDQRERQFPHPSPTERSEAHSVSTTWYAYDGAGRLATIDQAWEGTDEHATRRGSSSRERTYGTDGKLRRVRLTERGESTYVSDYRYDYEGASAVNVVVWDHRGFATRSLRALRDPAGRVVSIQAKVCPQQPCAVEGLHLFQTQHVDFDEKGRLSRVVERLEPGERYVTTFTYDASSNLVEARTDQGAKTFSYDGEGRPTGYEYGRDCTRESVRRVIPSAEKLGRLSPLDGLSEYASDVAP